MDLYVIKVFDGLGWHTLEPTSTLLFGIAKRNLKYIQYQYRHLPEKNIKIGKLVYK